MKVIARPQSKNRSVTSIQIGYKTASNQNDFHGGYC